MGLQSRTFSHPDLRETSLLNIPTCYFPPNMCVECAFSGISSAGLLHPLLVFTVLSFCCQAREELYLFPSSVVFFSFLNSVSDSASYLPEVQTQIFSSMHTIYHSKLLTCLLLVLDLYLTSYPDLKSIYIQSRIILFLLTFHFQLIDFKFCLLWSLTFSNTNRPGHPPPPPFHFFLFHSIPFPCIPFHCIPRLELLLSSVCQFPG